MKRKRLIVVGVVLVVGTLGWLNARQQKDSSASAGRGPKGAPLVKVAKVQKGNLEQEVVAPGTLEAAGPQEIRAPFASTQVQVLVKEGDQVQKGQVLARLNADELQAQVTAQESAVAQAQAAVQQVIHQEKLAPLQMRQRLEAANAQLIQAETALAAAQQQSVQSQAEMAAARAKLEESRKRSEEITADLSRARQALEAAREQRDADPANEEYRAAYEAAVAAFDEAADKYEAESDKIATELAQAYDNMARLQKQLPAQDGQDSPAVRQARSQVESARTALALAKQESKTGGSMAQEVKLAEVNLQTAEKTLAQLRSRVEKAAVRAPASGKVLTLGTKDGQPAQPGQTLLVLGDVAMLTVKIRVDEVDIGKFEPEQELTLKSNAFPQATFVGKVVRVAEQSVAANASLAPSPGGSLVDAQGAMGGGNFFEVEGEVANPDGKLRPGMSAEVYVLTDSRADVLAVGLESVREEEGQAFVLVVKDYKVEVRSVKLGLRTQARVEILEGLRESEEIVASPFNLVRSLRAGDPVRIEDAH